MRDYSRGNLDGLLKFRVNDKQQPDSNVEKFSKKIGNSPGVHFRGKIKQPASEMQERYKQLRTKTSQIVKKNFNGGNSGSKTTRLSDHDFNSLQYVSSLDRPKRSMPQLKLSFRPSDTKKKGEIKRNNSESRIFTPIR